MRKQGVMITALLLLLLSFSGIASADLEIMHPWENAYYLHDSEILLQTDDVSQDVYSGIKWYYNGEMINPIDGNFIAELDSINEGDFKTAVVKAVYEGQTKQVKFKIYNESVIENSVNYLSGIQSSDGSFGGYTGHYYIGAVLGDAGVDINIPKQGEKTYLEYLSSLNIGESSSAGELAKLVYALASMKQNPTDFNGKDITKLLLDSQKNDGTFGEGVYTDVLAVIALDKAGIEIPKKNELIKYFEGLNYNNGLYEDWGFIDIDTTARIVRCLKIMGCENTHSVIGKAIEAINKAQTDSGAVEAWGMPNFDTTAEVIMMLLDLDINPTEGIWNKNGKNLISAVLGNQDEDGSFKSGFDKKYSTYEELSALTGYYLKYHTLLSGGNNNSGGGSGSNSGSEKTGSIIVNVSVIGKGGEKVFSAKSITIDDNAKYGKTVLQALLQTGLDFKTKNDDSYVSEINGTKEDLYSTAGWKYMVNGKVPGFSAKNCLINKGDEVVWFWAESAESDSPSATNNEEQVSVPAMLQEQEQTVSAMVYSFSDVTVGCFGWAKKEIEYIASMGIIQGTEGGRFEPGRGITREESVKIIMLAIGEKSDNNGKTEFKDQKDISIWAVPHVSGAKRIGLVKGYEDDTFRPGEAVSRFEMAAMIANAMSYKELVPKEKEKVQFSDWNMAPEWVKGSILKAGEAGIVKGKEKGLFAGYDCCTRAEAAVMIYRFLKLQ